MSRSSLRSAIFLVAAMRPRRLACDDARVRPRHRLVVVVLLLVAGAALVGTTKGEDTTPRFRGELAPATSTGDLLEFLAGALPLSEAGERSGDGITDVRIEGKRRTHPALFARSEVTFDAATIC
jgi:hypothetical protein